MRILQIIMLLILASGGVLGIEIMINMSLAYAIFGGILSIFCLFWLSAGLCALLSGDKKESKE